ncbi:MAG: TM2 domain-containing protein [Planctomycetota bacterium]|nr:TM2 domain-containing protein [Planctomycetota bacterium]
MAMQSKTPAVQYEMVSDQETHSVLVGYLFWIFGFFGLHRFYFGKPWTGVLWFFTLGLLLVGWLVDAFLVPSMNREANHRYVPGPVDYNLAWVLLVFLGWLGLHRFYMGKVISGLIYLLTLGLLGFGCLFDLVCLNNLVSQENYRRKHWLN